MVYARDRCAWYMHVIGVIGVVGEIGEIGMQASAEEAVMSE